MSCIADQSIASRAHADSTGVAPRVPPARRWAVLAVLGVALLLIAVDATVLNLAIPALARDLQPGGTELLWILDAYSLVLAGLLVTMGAVGDRWGRKRTLLLGVAVFGAASALAAFAPSSGALIAARVLLGLGGAMIMPSTLSIIRALFVDRRERTIAIGVWGAVAGAGAALGPIVGGILLERFWWGSVFLINVPIMVIGLVVGASLIPESRDPRPGPWDAPSVLASVIGMVAVVYAIKEGSTHGPLDVRCLAAGALGIGLLTYFVRRQLRLRHPLLDVTLFRDSAFSAAAACNLAAMFGLSGTLFLLSQLLQFILHYTPLDAGLRLLPASVGAAVAAGMVGPLARRFGFRAPVSLGLLVAGAGLFALAGFGPGDGYAGLGLALLGIGIGAGLAMTASSDVIVSTAPAEKAGGAAAISETGYELGTALGVAILGSIMNGVYRNALAGVPGAPDEAVAAAQTSLASAVEVAGQLGGGVGDALLDTSRAAFVAGMDATVTLGGVVVILAAIAAWRLLPSGDDRA